MLTIRQVLSTGYEFVFEAKRVNYQPANAELHDLETLFIETPAGGGETDTHTLVSGVYFVMNDAGKTVAKYDLGPEPKL